MKLLYGIYYFFSFDRLTSYNCCFTNKKSYRSLKNIYNKQHFTHHSESPVIEKFSTALNNNNKTINPWKKKNHLKSSSGFKSYVHPDARNSQRFIHTCSEALGAKKNLSQIPARFRGLKAHRRTILFRRKQTTKRRIDTRSNTEQVESKFFSSLSDRAKRARFPVRWNCLSRVVEVFFPSLIGRKEIKETGSSLVYNYFRSY